MGFSPCRAFRFQTISGFRGLRIRIFAAMGKSYISNHVHFVFSTKNRERNLSPEIRSRLWQYIGGIAKKNGMNPIAIGGYEDHCHALISLESSMSIAKAAQYLKGG